MLYGDFIDLTQEDTPRTPAPQDAVGEVRGHGTGLSTDSDPESRSLPAFSNPWNAFTVSLSVLGNAIAGAAFLGGLFYAPHLLARLVDLL
jgi:hypothetical protein